MDINADHYGWTPLHVAALWNPYSVIQELAHFGGSALNWNSKTDDRQSALDLTLGAGPNREVQRLLLSKKLGRRVVFADNDDTETDDQCILTPSEDGSDAEAWF